MPRKSKIDLQVCIRRCNGNKDCWAAVCGEHDFLMATSYSLDTLVKIIGERHPGQAIAVSA